MKRWIVVLFVAAALVILISPGIVGHLAERNLQQNINWAEAERPEFLVATESFDRGWFSSAGRHRLSLAGTPVPVNSGNPASIVIETRVDHGLVPFTSMSREGGSLEPGLAQAVSTFQLDLGDGELIDLPGKAFSRIGLSGVTDIHYVVEKGSHQEAGQTAHWDGADLTATVNPDGRTLTLSGTVQPVTFDSAAVTGSIGAMEIHGMEQRTDYGFSIGEIDVTTGAIRFTGSDGVSGGFESLQLKGETRLEEAQVNADYSVNVRGLTTPLLGELGMNLDFSLAGLDAAALGRISTTVREAETSTDPSQAMAGFYPLIEQDLQALLAAGGSIDISRFDLNLAQGAIASKFNFTVDKSDPAASFSWPAFALLLSANADISMPEMLVDMMLMFSPQADAVRQMGLLRKNGNNYELQAAFKQGLLTVNGAPFPIPLQGF